MADDAFGARPPQADGPSPQQPASAAPHDPAPAAPPGTTAGSAGAGGPAAASASAASASAGVPTGGAGGSADPDDDDPVDAEVLAAEEAVENDLAALQRERDDYLDALRRLQADFENFKKRTLKQQTEHLERAAQHLVEKLLPVLDAADMAIAHGGGEVLAPVAGLLMDLLIREGLDGIDPKPGEPFDPTVHEAVAHEPGDSAHQEIADLLRPGYRWKGALLRPAMVKVRG